MRKLSEYLSESHSAWDSDKYNQSHHNQDSAEDVTEYMAFINVEGEEDENGFNDNILTLIPGEYYDDNHYQNDMTKACADLIKKAYKLRYKSPVKDWITSGKKIVIKEVILDNEDASIKVLKDISVMVSKW